MEVVFSPPFQEQSLLVRSVHLGFVQGGRLFGQHIHHFIAPVVGPVAYEFSLGKRKVGLDLCGCNVLEPGS
jgi:hypothetical protein